MIRNLAVLVGDIPSAGSAVVETQVQVGAEAFKKLELVVELGVAHKAADVV